MIRFNFLTGDINFITYGGKFISSKQNNGDFNYWIIMEVINWYEAIGGHKAPAKYNVSLSAVSPSKAGEKHLRDAYKCIGIEFHLYATDLEKVIALSDYGIASPLWSQDGNNLNGLMKEARKQAQCISSLFGFYMDGPKNRIGSTGWDFIKGDIDRPLRELQEV